MGVGSYPANAAPGDFYSSLEIPSTGSLVPRGIRRYSPNGGTPLEVIDLTSIFSLISSTVQSEDFDTVRIYCDDIYAIINNESGTPSFGYLVKTTGATPHVSTVLHDFSGNGFGDRVPFNMTFDNQGNIFVLLQDSTLSSFRLWKLDKTGILIHRYVLTGGFFDRSWCWLAGDERTLYYLTQDAHGDVNIRMWDVVADVSLGVYCGPIPDTIFKAGNAWESASVLFLTDGTFICPQRRVTPSSVLARRFDSLGNVLNTYTTDVGGSTAGGNVDIDPDGTSLWVGDLTCDHGFSSHGMNKFDIVSGILLNKIFFYDENGFGGSCGGAGGSYNEQSFAIANGAGFRGSNGCPSTVARFFMNVTLVGAT